MKKLILFLLSLFIFVSGKADTVKLKSSSYAFRSFNDYNKTWNNWPVPTSTAVLITMNVDEDRITIYSSQRQEYDIYRAYDAYYNREGDKVYEFSCLDKDGKQCLLRIHYVGQQRGGGIQLYIEYSDMQWMYNVSRV